MTFGGHDHVQLVVKMLYHLLPPSVCYVSPLKKVNEYPISHIYISVTNTP